MKVRNRHPVQPPVGVPYAPRPRQARLVDGASEIHKMVLSKYYLAEKHDFFKWGV